MMDKIDNAENRFSFLITQLFKKLNLLNRDQKVCYGITLSQCCVIETLEQKGILTMNELSNIQGVSLSTMTRLVDILVRDDIVQRVKKGNDRRKVNIELTKKGKELAKKLKKCTEIYSKNILDKIPNDQHFQVLKSVELLIAAIEKVNSRCCF